MRALGKHCNCSRVLGDELWCPWVLCRDIVIMTPDKNYKLF